MRGKYNDPAVLAAQEQLRAKRELIKLELDLMSAAVKLNKAEKDVLTTLKQQELYGIMRKTILIKDEDVRERIQSLSSQLASDERDVAIAASEALGYRKRQIPFAEEMASIEEHINEIKSDWQSRGLKMGSNLERQEAATLKRQLKRYETLSLEKQKWDEIGEIQERSLSMFGLSIDKLQEIGAQIDKMLMSPLLAIIGLFTLAIAKFISLDAAAEKFRTETGLTKLQSKAIADNARDIFETYKDLGVTYEDTLDSASALFKIQQNANLISKDNVETVTLLAENYGIAKDASAGFIREMKAATNFTDDKIQSIVGGLLNVSQVTGVSAAAVMQDIADVSEEGYAFLSKYPTKFIETAIRARQLGIDMNKLTNTTKSLLDFETSIGDEMEASILIGKNLNLNAARYYALQGDQGKMLDEILKNVGSVSDFNKMNILQQQAIAKAVGMETKDLAVILKNKELQHKADLGIEDAETKAWKIENERRGVITKMKNAWDSIVSSVSSIFLPVIEIVLPYLATMAHWVSSIAKGFERLPAPVQKFASALVVAGAAFLTISKAKGIGGVLGRLTGSMSKGGVGAAGGEGAGGRAFQGLGTFLKGTNPAQLLAGGVAMIMIAGAIWILAKAMQEFSTGVTWDGVLKGIVAMGALVGAVALLGVIMMSGVGAVAMIAGAAAILIIAGAMYVLGEAMKLISESGDGSLKFLVGLGSVDAGHILALAGSLAVLGTAMTGVAIASTVLAGLSALFGGGGAEKKTQQDKIDMLIDAVNEVRDVIVSKEFSTNLDGRKVSKGLALANNY